MQNKKIKAGKKVLLIALGGNAMIGKGEEGNIEQQFENLRVPVGQIAELSKSYKIIITHGNGPQVGNLLLQQEYCELVPGLPLEILVAQTQGQIGYMIESTLDSELMGRGIHSSQKLVSLISYVVVDENDSAFRKPSKPIGPFFTKETAMRLPYPVVETEKGFRRVVASPLPVTIVEKREIRALIDIGFIVICCGGGGIPVTRDGRMFTGVNAVIDKDLASARLAEEVGVHLLLIVTDVQGVALDYNTPRQQFLASMTVAKARRWMIEGHFSEGSMGPKVQAAIQFRENGGERAVITSTQNIIAAVQGKAGTEII